MGREFKIWEINNLDNVHLKDLTKKYSKITTRSYKTHVYDRVDNKILCGLNMWHHTPFNIYRTTFTAKGIHKKLEKQAHDRGYPSPYKFVCRGCMKKAFEINNKEVKEN